MKTSMRTIEQDIKWWSMLRELYRHLPDEMPSTATGFPGICQQIHIRNRRQQTSRRRRFDQFLNVHWDVMAYPRGQFWWSTDDRKSRAMACTRVLVQLRKEARRVRS